MLWYQLLVVGVVCLFIIYTFLSDITMGLNHPIFLYLLSISILQYQTFLYYSTFYCKMKPNFTTYLLIASIPFPYEAEGHDSVRQAASLLADVLARVHPGRGVAWHPGVHDEGPAWAGVHPAYYSVRLGLRGETDNNQIIWVTVDLKNKQKHNL